MSGVYRCRMGDAEALQDQGPLVLGQLTLESRALARARSAGLSVPPRTVHLLVETGAATSGIGHDIALSLGLIADEVISVVSVTQTVMRTPVFPASLALWLEGDGPPRSELFPLRMVGLPPSRSGAFDGVLGRDFLQRFELRYFGPDGRFELTLRGDAGG